MYIYKLRQKMVITIIVVFRQTFLNEQQQQQQTYAIHGKRVIDTCTIL